MLVRYLRINFKERKDWNDSNESASTAGGTTFGIALVSLPHKKIKGTNLINNYIFCYFVAHI
jgi:hypothetical protein